ncbi:10444_t:CDS:1 [Cetraspora pellucida]|uniref:10444_t:CDS:1 n=1 Tax=Cetraspora pellucida TaxID=1433469 RepID=A0A9N8W1C5_9GLOM|nr:10444_t:CDS:1 [Cetraspora pellucida]
MVKKLPDDCLDQIFRYLVENACSLYSCLLVNKQWASVAIPILWTNPWKYENPFKDEVDETFWPLIIKTVYSCFSFDTKDLLRKNGLDLILQGCASATFDYVRYCQHLSPEIIDQLTHERTFNEPRDHRPFRDYLVEQELYKLFMSRSSLRHLVLPKTPLSYCPGFGLCLQKLRELVCRSDHSVELFYGLAQTCKSIQGIIVDPCFDDNAGLAALIEFQTNLKYLEIHAPEAREVECTLIGQAIVTQAHTLIYVHFQGFLCIHPSTLGSLYNLKTLKLFMSGHIKNIQEFASSTFSKLEILDIFWDEQTPFEIFTKLIQNTKGSLKRIYWNTDCPPKYSEDIRNYLNILTHNTFSNLTFATVWWTEEVDQEFEKFLKTCTNLQALKICSFPLDGIPQSITRLLQILIKHAPNSLNVLDIDGDWILTPDHLRTFFDSWKKKPRLSLFISPKITLLDDHKCLINFYRNIGVLKHFQGAEFLDEVECLKDIFDLWLPS